MNVAIQPGCGLWAAMTVLKVFAMCLLVTPVQVLGSEDEQQLRRVIEDQQRQIDELKRQVDELKQLVQERSSGKDSRALDAEKKEGGAVGKSASGSAVVSTEAPATGRTSLSQVDKNDQKHPTGSNFAVADHSKTIPIPGMNLEIGIHGFVELQAMHDTDGFDDNEFDTVHIPVDGSPSQTKFNVNPSRLEISTKSYIPDGTLNTFFSMDLNGKVDSPDPRLRQAYAELIWENRGAGVLAGQAFTTMLDLKATPETLDFAGPAGAFDLRQPLVRVGKLFADELLLEVAAETPENVAYADADARTRWPDFATAVTWRTGGKYVDHLRLAGLVRDLRAEGTNGATDSAVGWCLNGSGEVDLPFLGSRDNLRVNVNYGDGYGAQIKGGPNDAAFNLGDSQLRTIGMFGVDIGLQHWWSKLWRSNAVFGYVDADNPGFVDDDLLDNTTYVALNVIYNPYEPVTVGLEWLWGERQNIDGASGTDNRFLLSSKVAF